jgi:hypothetical protein
MGQEDRWGLWQEYLVRRNWRDWMSVAGRTREAGLRWVKITAARFVVQAGLMLPMVFVLGLDWRLTGRAEGPLAALHGVFLCVLHIGQPEGQRLDA